MDEPLEHEYDTTSLTRGRPVDGGWVLGKNGNWTASIWDRRRSASTELGLVAQVMGGFVPMVAIAGIVEHHAVSASDTRLLRHELDSWLAKVSDSD